MKLSFGRGKKKQAAPPPPRTIEPRRALQWIKVHGLHVTERAVAGGGSRVCGHCGFPALDLAARYRPKCGMRHGV